MKRILVLVLILSFVYGCGDRGKDKSAALKINGYEITKEEFETEFKDSSFASADTPESRKAFLDSFIFRQLILQDAQEAGLDKGKDFLEMIQKFWAQSLLKLALDKKSNSIAGSIHISDREVKEAYDNLIKENNLDKTYEQLYQQLKWDLTKLKESQSMDNWLKGLRKNSRIQITQDLSAGR